MALLSGGKLDLTIANSGTISNTVPVEGTFSGASRLKILAATVLATDGTYTIEITDDIGATSPVWRTLTGEDDSDVIAPAAGKCKDINEAIASSGIRIKSSGAVTGAKVWTLFWQNAYGN